MKIYICLKHYHSIYEFKKAHLKTRNRGGPILLFEEIKGKLFMCPATGIDKGIIMDQNSICLLVRYGDHYWSRWSMDSKHLNKIETKYKKFKEGASWIFKMIIQTTFRTAS